MISIIASAAVLLLPDPILGEVEAGKLVVNYSVAMDGTRYSYIKNPSQKTFNYDFESIGLGKIVEVQEFFRLYIDETLHLIDFRGDEWDVKLITFPIDSTTDKKTKNAGAAREESGSFTLEFAGTSA